MNKKIILIPIFIMLFVILGGSYMLFRNSQQSNANPSVDLSTSSSTKSSSEPSAIFLDELDLQQIDFEKAHAYGLADGKHELKKEYFELQNFYRNLVCDYINQHIDFTNFDQEISQLEISKYFKLVQKPLKQVDSREDYFSSVSSLDSQYLYLRNHIFIERLSKDEFQTLKEIRKGKIQNQQELAGFVQQTLVKVLSYYKDSKFSETAVQYRDYGGTVEVDIRQSSILFSVEYRKPSSYDGIPYFSDAQSSKRREELLKYDALVPKYEEIFSKELGLQVQIENSLYSSIRRT